MIDYPMMAQSAKVWRDDPVRMVVELFGVEPDRWQVDVLRNFPDQAKRRMAMQACAGPGKSAVESWCGWNFLLCRGGPEDFPQGAAMSVTAENLKNGLWKELAYWRDRSELLKRVFDMTADAIRERLHPQLWFLAARSWSKTANAEEQGRTLSGLHAKNILYLIDEMGDIAPAVLRSATQGLSNCEWGKIVGAGNPTSHKGMLYHIVTVEPHLWYVKRITGDPDDPDRSPRIDIEEARQQIEIYGRNNPWVMAYILGQFPPTSINALLGPDEVQTAMERHHREPDYDFSQKRIGVDIARFGDDATIMAPRQGLACFNLIEMRNATGPQVAARLMKGKMAWKSELELIDATGGHASSVIDFCRQAGVNLFEVDFSGKADDRKYFNKRSEMAFRCADWVKGGGALPNDAQLKRELIATTYYFEGGKFRVTEKAQVKKELQGHSPDRSDALWTTFALPDMPSMAAAPLFQDEETHHAKTEWEPIA